jgi:rhodanese-related sulfurtransferase
MATHYAGTHGNKETRYPVAMIQNLDYEIQPEAVKELQGAGKVVLLDVRESWERETARIEPSLHIPMGDVPARVQELDPDDHVVVYCHMGVRSLNVTAWLRQQGYENAQSMAGGIDRWSRFVDPKVPIY